MTSELLAGLFFLSITPGSLLGLLLKGALLCVIGVSIGNELSAMPAVARHRIALATVVSLIALPFVAALIRPWELPILYEQAVAGEDSIVPIIRFMTWAYIAVALSLLSKLLFDLLQIARISGRASGTTTADKLVSEPTLECGATPVKFSAEIGSPLTWGWLRPKVLLPKAAVAWEKADLSMVLQHELAHMQRMDWAIHLLARCVHALYWPVPGIRALLSQLSLSAEQAADDRVLAAGTDAPEYAAMLLKIARGDRVPASVPLGRSTELGVRVRNLVVEIVDHDASSAGAVVTALAFVALTVPIATVQLGSRPEIPFVDWGSGVPGEARSTVEHISPVLVVDYAVLTALESGPARPQPPPPPQRPPKFNSLAKPTLPPPATDPAQ